jgi:hypothetical protein
MPSHSAVSLLGGIDDGQPIYRDELRQQARDAGARALVTAPPSEGVPTAQWRARGSLGE